MAEGFNLPPGVSPDDVDGRGVEDQCCGNCAECWVRAAEIDPDAPGGGPLAGTCDRTGRKVELDGWCSCWKEG